MVYCIFKRGHWFCGSNYNIIFMRSNDVGGKEINTQSPTTCWVLHVWPHFTVTKIIWSSYNKLQFQMRHLREIQSFNNVDPYYGTLCITYKYNKSSIVSHKHLQATLLNFKELCGEYTFLYYIINRTRTHKTKHLYVCVYMYTVDPHYSQISYCAFVYLLNL